MENKTFRASTALYLAPLVVFCVASFWLPRSWFSTPWGLVAFWTVAALLWLPWLKARIYPNEPLVKVLFYELTGLGAVALVFFLRSVWGRVVDGIVIGAFLVGLVWFAFHERQKNQAAPNSQPPA